MIRDVYLDVQITIRLSAFYPRDQEGDRGNYEKMLHAPGACPGFLKGGSNISWFPKKRSSDFKRGVQWSDGGSST